MLSIQEYSTAIKAGVSIAVLRKIPDINSLIGLYYSQKLDVNAAIDKLEHPEKTKVYRKRFNKRK